MAHHKSYRKRAAEAFRSGVESPLEALGSRALREAQAELQRKAAELDDRDPAALEMLEEALAHEPRDAHERRAAARAFLGVTRTKSATRVETKDNERDVWTSWVDVGFPIADKMMRAGIAERVESGRITEDEAQELLDLLDAIRDNSSNDKIEPDYYEDLVADMRELGDRVATMDWGNSFPYENWHRDADEIEKYGDGLRDWYGDDWKGAYDVETKGSKRDFWNAVKDVVAAAQGENLSEDIFDAVNALRDANDSEECFDNLTIIAESAGSSTAMQDAADRALEYYDEVGTDKERSASDVETKGAMPIVAFDAANEEGLDDLEADVNELAYKHNASGMDADTSGGHCEVYFEAAIDAANFVEALQAGDLIGYTVSSVELVPTDPEDKSAGAVRMKGIDQTIEEALSVASSARDLGERAVSGGDRVISAAESLMDILNGDLDYNAYQDAESACGDLIDELNGVEVDPDEDFGDDGEEDPVSALQTELADLGRQFGAMSEDD